MSREVQPPILSVSLALVKMLPTEIKNELPESEIMGIGIDDILDSSELEEEIIPDVKGIDIVYHPVCGDFIKSEILESNHCKSVETQVSVKAENFPFIKTENITQRNNTEDTSDENVTKGTGQAVIEVAGSYEHSNTLSNLETHKQLVLNSSKDLNGIGTKKVKVIKAPVIPVEAHEYTSLPEDKYVCNHCQHASNNLYNIKLHIRKMHREVTTMYQCPYCPYKSKWSIRKHIILKHKDTKDIQWFQCHLCDKKFKLKSDLTKHKVNLTHEQMQNGLDLKGYHCDTCDYTTYRNDSLKRHKLTHLKPEETQYFYCYHCSYKSKQKSNLRNHIFRQHFKNVKQGKRHQCDRCNYKSYTSTMLKTHKLNHLKPEDIPYFHCYHCSYKSKRKEHLKEHIFIHFKKEQVKFDCYICNFMTQKRESIIEHIKKHSKVQIKYEINKENVFD